MQVLHFISDASKQAYYCPGLFGNRADFLLGPVKVMAEIDATDLPDWDILDTTDDHVSGTDIT
jgi:hypothetical protein